MKKLIEYFCNKHVLVNLITGLILFGGYAALNQIDREELPDITFNFVRITTSYAGASAADIEFYITNPLEESIQGLDGINKIESTSSIGRSSISVELTNDVDDITEKLNEIKSQISGVALPSDIKTLPQVRIFETSKKAIVDIALYNTNTHLLTTNERSELQATALALKNQLLRLPEVFEVRESGVLDESLQIQIDPNQMLKFDIDLNQIATDVKNNQVQTPVGTLNNPEQDQVSLINQLNTPEAIQQLTIQGSLDSPPIRLDQLGKVFQNFNQQDTIYKVNGSEAIIFNVVKNKSTGILKAIESINNLLDHYQQTVLKDTPYAITIMDDESIDLRNRLQIVSSNGLLGFGLIFLLLMTFLNKRAGFWVALGIPFSLSVTLIVTNFMGYSINVITLSAVIIVLGIVVDDAIIVAENITKKMQAGLPLKDAAIIGTQEVTQPIIASILTTCIAFLPLLFFDGRFGSFVQVLAPVIFLMLGASLIESLFLLPSHMTLLPYKPKKTTSFFTKLEARYTHGIKRILNHPKLTIIVFIALLIGTLQLSKSHFKFVLFPNVESREIVMSGTIESARTLAETAIALQPLESYLNNEFKAEGLSVRTTIGQSRRGAVNQPNQYTTTFEIVPKNKRKKTTQDIIAAIKTYTQTNKNYDTIRFRKNRYGQDSGSVFEIAIQESDDATRDALSNKLIKALEELPQLTNIETDKVLTKSSYQLDYNQTQLKQLLVSPANLSTTLRTILTGNELYTFLKNDVEIDVELSVLPNYKDSITPLLTIPISNQQGYMIPLNDVVSAKQQLTKQSIRRQNLKRTSFVYADLTPSANQSPLEVATIVESQLFPKLLQQFPTAQLLFEGEVVDTRQSKKSMMFNVIIVFGLIYTVLAVLFNSFFKPIRILLIIPFGIIGVLLAFYLHQKTMIGFYACIGTIGMIGVVINDGIVMLDRMDKTIKNNQNDIIGTIATVAGSRLRAIVLTTLTTVIGLFPTAYGILGYDAMLADMMLALAWGLIFGTLITLILIPCIVAVEQQLSQQIKRFTPKLFTVFVLALICFTTPGFASEPMQQELSLATFLTAAKKENQHFHAQLTESYKIKYNVDINVDYADLLADLAINQPINNNDDETNIVLGLSQTIPSLGQEYDVTYSNTSDSYAFIFTQDIAQNAFGKNNKLSHQLQHIQDDISRYQITESYEDYYAEIIHLYYNWVRQYQSMILAQSAYNETQKGISQC